MPTAVPHQIRRRRCPQKSLPLLGALLLFLLAISPARATVLLYATVYDSIGDDGGAILFIDDSGHASLLAGGFVQPAEMAFDSGGNILVIDGGVISRVAPSGQVQPFATVPISGAFGGLAVDSQNNVYAAGGTGGPGSAIYKFDPSGALLDTFDTGFAPVNSLAFGPDGYLYGVTPFGSEISRFSPLTGERATYAELPEEFFPMALAFGTAGEIFVTGDDEPGQVLRVTGDGSTVEPYVTGGLDLPMGVAYVNGGVYVADWGCGCEELSYISFAPGPGSATPFVTLTFAQTPMFLLPAIPEPATFILSALGLFGLACMQLRRIRKPSHASVPAAPALSLPPAPGFVPAGPARHFLYPRRIGQASQSTQNNQPNITK